MNKQVKYTYSGMRQDTSNSKFSNEFYFEGMNIRILSTDIQSSGAITNTKGNEFLLKIPIPVINFVNKEITYNTTTLQYVSSEIDSLVNSNVDQIIISNCKTKNGFVIFSTNNSGLDCIWFLDEITLDIKLLYLRNLNFNTLSPIQSLNNYENEKIDKIYWVDGKEQLRVINQYHSIENDDVEELIDLSQSLLSVVADVNFSKLDIENISYGGSHTAGMIQYCYCYYKINGSETIISPLSNIIPLGKSLTQGGDLNEVVGTIPKLVINNLDSRFSNIKIYAIKYTSINELPSVNVIADRSISNLSSITYYDDGRVLYPSTLETIALSFNKILIPKHIESKNNRLFAFNYKNRFYKLSQNKNNLDCRAYSFPLSSSSTTVFSNIFNYNDITEVATGTSNIIDYNTNILNPNFLPYNNASINGNYRINKYQPNSNRLGGEGYYLKYEILRTNDPSNDIYDYRFFKDNELYRLGIQFYNKYGTKSAPNWIADYVVQPENGENNLSGYYAGLKLTLKPEFFVWLNTQSNFLDNNGTYDDFLKPVGFKLLRGDRTSSDKSILSQGLINGMMSVSSEKGHTDIATDINRANNSPKCPSLMRRFDNYLCPMYKNSSYDRLDNTRYGLHPQWRNTSSLFDDYSSIEVYSPKSSDNERTSMYQFNQLMQFYSPEITFNMVNNIESTKINVVGGIINNFNGTKARFETWNDARFFGYAYFNNVLSPYDIKYPGLWASDYNRRGIYGPDITRSSANRNDVITLQYFRDYTGDLIPSDSKLTYDIYGKAEIASVNQGITKYNNDIELSYLNNLNIVRTGLDTSGDDTALDYVVTQGAKSAVFALGDDTQDTKDRTTIEDIFNDSNIESSISGSSTTLNPKIKLDIVVSKYSEALVTLFPNKYLGVLENNNVYFNDDLVNVQTTFNIESVDLIFDSIASYNAEATTTVDNWTGLKVVIIDGVDNIIYSITNQLIGISGLNDTLLRFKYMEDIAVSPIDQYLLKLLNMYDYDTSLISDGYTVGILEDMFRYRWDLSTSAWVKELSLTLPIVSSSYKGGAGLIIEFINDEKLKYIGNYYGGNSHEAKTKTIYVEASDYYKLDSTSIFDIKDPGDIFVQDYSILRLCKTEQLPVRSNYKRISEIIKVRLESTVNQNKRNDESRFEWEDTWQPSQGDYHNYNRVYSQSSNLIKSQDTSYEVKQNELYDSGIIASNFKKPGEIIDSWTNFSILDTLNLEGKYGSINAVVKHKDEILTFQDNAIAQISINPRVQIQGDDGIAIKLGTGNLLDRYTYINTNSGTLNKWGVISTNSGIFYYDTINNSLNIISNDSKLSDLKHLHSFFQKNINNDIIKKDNHILKNGIQFGYDYLNNDIYFTFLQGNNSKTINFNELQNEFVSLHGFKPSFYFNKGNLFLTTESSNTELYNHLEGLYNTYYGEESPSYIIYNLNPEPDTETIFDNIEFKSELYLNGVDIPDQTITDIQCYNEYQNSGLVPLVNGRNGNLRRKFRNWNAFIPREGRFRIRGPYSKLKLEFKNDNNKKLILHDMIVSYTT